MPEREEGVERPQTAVDLHFERSAGYWSDVYGGGRVESAVYRERRDRALATVQRLALPAGAAVLELGCGAGELATRLALSGYDVTATDTVDAMLEQTRRRAESDGARLAVAHADAHQLPFADESFHVVVGLGVLPWLHSPPRALLEIRRVTRPGGHVLLSADGSRRLNELFDPWLSWTLRPVRSRLRERLEARAGRPQPVSYRRHRAGEVTELLRGAGLEPLSAEAIGFGPFTVYRRPLLPEPAGLRVNTTLQAWADRGMPLLRGGAVHHLLLARRPG